MGSLHSKTSYVYLDYGYYKTYINTLDTESVSRVYNKILADKFRTRKQMQACGILIYEKAVDEPNFSLKCAQLAKELEDEIVIEDCIKHIFHVVFSDYLIPFITFIIAKYDDKYMNKQLVQRGMGISTFIGNLYNVGFYGLPQIVEMAQKAQKRVTPKSAFFMENILNTCSEKLESKHVSLGFFEMMVAKYRREDFFDSTQTQAKDEPRTDFIQFLYKMKTENRHEFFQRYLEFKSIPDQVHKMEIKFLMKYILENEKFLNIYRFVALEIHRMRPDLLKIDLKFEFDKAIEKYEIIQDVNSAENIKNFEHLGKVVIEFYSAGLIDDEVVEHFLNVAKSAKMPIKIFNLIFVEVLKKYEGKHLMDYYRHLSKKCKKLPEMQINVAIVEDYVLNRAENCTLDSEEQLFESEAAAQPDLGKFTASLNKHQLPFNCDDRPSCHVASLRGFDILMRHIGHRFFTPERIEVCVKMTRSFSKISIEDRIRERIENEMKVYLPYFKQNHSPSMQMKRFSNLLVVLYIKGILRHDTMGNWMKQFYDVVKIKRHRTYGQFIEVYLSLCEKLDNNFLCDDPNSWLMHSNFIDSLEYSELKFDDFDKFKELVENCKNKSEFSDMKKLDNLEIPNDKIALKQISRFLIDFYINNKTSPSLITSILFTLSEKCTPKIDNNILQSEFQDALCLKLSLIFAINKKDGSKLHSHAVLITDLVEVMCIKNQSSRLELAEFYDVILKMAAKYDNLYPVFNFIKFSTEKLNKALNKKCRDPPKITVGHIKNKLEEVFAISDINELKIKEVKETFGDFLKNSNKKEGIGEKFTTHGSISCKETSKSSTQQQINIKTVTDYNRYCNYYHNITTKTIYNDKKLFNPNIISTLNINEKEQIVDFANKFIERILAGQSKVSFFAQNAVKLESILAKNKILSFKNILIDKVQKIFQNEEILVEFMCELYNNSFVNKASMIAFVDKFKSQSPENIILMHTFVRTCAIRLSSQGDKEQLMQIRTIARSVKNLSNFDQDLKLVAQNLEDSLDSLIKMIEEKTGDSKKIVNNLIQDAMHNSLISLKQSIKFDENARNLLNLKCQEMLKNIPKNIDHKNLIEFIARLYNFGILSTDFINWSIDLFLNTSNEEVSCQLLEILFRKCGVKLEKSNNLKLDVSLNFFETVLAENEYSIRSRYFKRLMDLKSQNWKTIQNSECFYENYLLAFKFDEQKFEEIIENFMTDNEEMDKFIQILWKILLKEKPNPSIASVCNKISKYLNEFPQKLSQFLSTRCHTFKKLCENSKLFDKNVKQRLGNVMIFVAEIYKKSIVGDDILEMWIDNKFIDSVPNEFVTKLFTILSDSRRFDGCKNDNAKNLLTNIQNKYYGAINERINLIIDDLNVENL